MHRSYRANRCFCSCFFLSRRPKPRPRSTRLQETPPSQLESAFAMSFSREPCSSFVSVGHARRKTLLLGSCGGGWERYARVRAPVNAPTTPFEPDANSARSIRPVSPACLQVRRGCQPFLPRYSRGSHRPCFLLQSERLFRIPEGFQQGPEGARKKDSGNTQPPPWQQALSRGLPLGDSGRQTSPRAPPAFPNRSLHLTENSTLPLRIDPHACSRRRRTPRSASSSLPSGRRATRAWGSLGSRSGTTGARSRRTRRA